MNYYNNKTKKRYEFSPLLVVGDILETINIIVEYGFFLEMICVYNGEKIPNKRQFIVSEMIPPDWNGEIIEAKNFVKTMNKKIKSTSKLSPYNYSNSNSSYYTSPASGGCGQCVGK
jgi:hypothetical protein